MEKRICNKLVRDNIVSGLEKSGIICETKVLNEPEMITALFAKVNEELEEIDRAKTVTDKLEEIADTLTVLYELKLRLETTPKDDGAEKLSGAIHKNRETQLQYVNSLTEACMIQAKALGCNADSLENLIISKQMVKGGFKDNIYLYCTIE